MKMIVSPAKSLDFETTLPTDQHTLPTFLKEAEKINGLLKKKSTKALGKLMGISEKLSELNWQRNQDFQLPFTPQNARPAIYAFNGDVYTGFDAYTVEDNQKDRMQNTLRILSGLYGVLKPFDLIQPYRLEMGTKMKIGAQKNLPSFWKKQLTSYLNSELQEGEVLVNLASNEYAAAVDFKQITSPVVHPQFKDFKNGKFKVISFFAKKARGSMARFIVDHQCETLADLHAFNTEGYSFSEEETQKESHPVFVR